MQIEMDILENHNNEVNISVKLSTEHKNLANKFTLTVIPKAGVRKQEYYLPQDGHPYYRCGNRGHIIR